MDVLQCRSRRWYLDGQMGFCLRGKFEDDVPNPFRRQCQDSHQILDAMDSQSDECRMNLSFRSMPPEVEMIRSVAGSPGPVLCNWDFRERWLGYVETLLPKGQPTQSIARLRQDSLRHGCRSQWSESHELGSSRLGLSLISRGIVPALMALDVKQFETQFLFPCWRWYTQREHKLLSTKNYEHALKSLNRLVADLVSLCFSRF